MDPAELPPLRAGLGGGVGLTEQDRHSIAALVCCFAEDAMVDAHELVEREGRGEVTAADVVTCLKVQALPETGFMTKDDILRRAAEHYRHLTQGTADGPAGRREPTPNLVQRAAAADADFARWEPQCPTERVLKRAILATEQKFLLSEEKKE